MKARDPDGDPAEVARAFEYDDGRLRHRAVRRWRRGSVMADTAIDGGGYRQTWYAGQLTKSHRLIFCLHHGRWPVNELDHRDGDRLNNRIENLREATSRQNKRNCRRRNNSGYHGVHRTRWNTYTTSIKGERDHLQLYGYPSAAYAAMIRDGLAAMMHGEFAVLNFPGFYGTGKQARP